MNTLQEKINQEINKLPLTSQKEVLDFVLFLKKRINIETDSDYLSKKALVHKYTDGTTPPYPNCLKAELSLPEPKQACPNRS